MSSVPDQGYRQDKHRVPRAHTRRTLADNEWLQALRHQRTRWIELILGFFLVMDAGDLPFWTLGIPPGPIAAATLAALLVLRFRIPRKHTGLATCALIAVVGAVYLSAYVAGDLNLTRLGTVTVWAALIYGIAMGCVHIPSLARGLGTGLVFAVIYGIVFIGQSSYDGRMTGVLGDPNTAGLILIGLGFVTFPFLRRPSSRILLAIAVIIGVFATESRTSMFALAVSILLALFAHRVYLWVVGISVGLAAWWLLQVRQASGEEQFFNTQWFEDRDGSDYLRSVLLVLEEQKRATAGAFGHGPGEAFVVLEDSTMMFSHNSYSAFMMEFGTVGVSALCVLGVVMILAVIRARRDSDPLLNWPLAAVIGALLCSINIGEAILTSTMAVALGMLLLISRRVGIHGLTRTPEGYVTPGQEAVLNR